jgi:hypothetical protein
MPQKSFALDSSSLLAIKKRNILINSVVNSTNTGDKINIKNGKTQVSNRQLGYDNVSPFYFQRGRNLIA